MEELAKRSGCHFIFSFEPRARIWAEIENGSLDMGTYGLETPDRDKFAWFAIYITTKFYAVVRKDLARSVKRAVDFTAQPSLKFGIVRSYSHGVG